MLRVSDTQPTILPHTRSGQKPGICTLIRFDQLGIFAKNSVVLNWRFQWQCHWAVGTHVWVPDGSICVKKSWDFKTSTLPSFLLYHYSCTAESFNETRSVLTRIHSPSTVFIHYHHKNTTLCFHNIIFPDFVKIESWNSKQNFPSCHVAAVWDTLRIHPLKSPRQYEIPIWISKIILLGN